MVSTTPFGYRQPIVGREREQEFLRACLAQAIEGRGGLVLVSGEAGIGKTTLVNDLIASGRDQGALVLTGGCYDLTTTPPYGPWSEAIRGYEPRGDLPPLPAWFGNPEELEQVGSQTALFEETLCFFAAIAEQQTLAVILEDLHWTDSASLEALRYLARSLGGIAVLLVATYREDEITRRHDLFQLLPLLVRESQVERVHLNRLDHADIEDIVAGRYDLEEPDVSRLVEHIEERSEGNPFFATEMLQGLEDEQVLQPVADGWVLGNLERTRMPILLRQALEFRLRHLSTDSRRALQLAAVIGQVVPIDRWQEIIDLDEDEFERAMTEAIAARVLEETVNTGVLQFRHALLREALYESVTLSRRRAWHRAAGELLAQIPSADPDAVAHHFQEAGDPRAAHWLIQAGARAERSYALPIAAGHYARAQALMEAEPDALQKRGWLLFHIGHLLRYSDRERSIANLEDAAYIARQVGDPVLAANSQSTHGLLQCFQGDLGAGLDEMECAIVVMDGVTAADLERANEAITSLFPSETFIHPAASSGGSFFRTGRLPGINTLTHTYVMWLAFAGRFHDAMRIGEAFVDQVAAATDDALLIQDACRDAYYGLATATYWLGRPDEARRWRTLALEAYETIGHRAAVRLVHHEELVHMLTYETDRVTDRRRAALAATATIEGTADHQLWGTGSGVLLDLIEGRWEQAHKSASVTLEKHDPFAQFYRAWIYRVLGREQHDEQFTALAQADIQNVLPGGPDTKFGQKLFRNTVIALQLVADIALDAGDLNAAYGWIAAHDRWLEWSGAVIGRADGHLLWARYHQTAGDLDAALRHAKQAIEHASDPRQPLALIAAHRCLGQLETEADRYNEAAENLQASLELTKRCEAPYEQALTLLAFAQSQLAAGNPETVKPLLDQARAICTQLQATPALNRLAALDRQLSSQRSAPMDYPDGLTLREVEVLGLLAAGLSNRELADTLFLSIRTVERHVTNIYGKIGARSRAEATAYAFRNDLADQPAT